MNKIKKYITSVAMATLLIVGATMPTSAATVKFTFKTSGTNYGITTQSTGFSGYVTSYAKVENNGAYVQKSSRGYKTSAASATKNCTRGTIIRTGWYSTL